MVQIVRGHLGLYAALKKGILIHSHRGQIKSVMKDVRDLLCFDQVANCNSSVFFKLFDFV